MCRLLIFGGTTEGRKLAELCAVNRIPVIVSVATDYGASMLKELCCLKIRTGRMDRGEMADFIRKNAIELVIDATHPFAVEATENISGACKVTGVRRLRVLREEIGGEGLYFDSAASAAEYLNTTAGTALITTGSKELSAFCAVENFRERCAVRVLPVAVEECIRLGFEPERIIAAQGPFSEEENIKHLRRYGASYLVTKDSGSAGGFGEKLTAAKKCGAVPLIIRRPSEEGISLKEAEKIILEFRGWDL